MGDSTDLFLNALQAMLSQLSARALNWDPKTQQQLEPLAGQVIEIQCVQPVQTWHLVIQPNQLDFVAGPAVTPNVIVIGTARALLHALVTGDSGWPLEVQGDATVLLKLQALVKGFSPDLAKPLSSVLSDNDAQRLTALFELGRDTLTNVMRAASEQAQDAAATLLTKRYSSESEADVMHQRLSALRLRVDRLQARLDLFPSAGLKP
jgi:ubiquinone biosynthesis protein UbiJ